MWLSIVLCLFALIGQGVATKLRCHGVDNGCCTIDQPCGVGDGDCDADYQCKKGLVCGESNCPWGDPDRPDDCCYDPKHRKPKPVVQENCEEHGVDYFGHDLNKNGRTLKVDSWMECSQICRSVALCQYWSYLKKWKVCYLKDSKEKEKKKEGSVSGSRSCGPKSGCPEYRTDYFGQDLKTELKVHKWQKCADLCKQNDKCHYWSYLKKWKVCYLKTTNGGKKTKVGSVSGRKNCGPPSDARDSIVEKRNFHDDCIKKACKNGNWDTCRRNCEIYLQWKRTQLE